MVDKYVYSRRRSSLRGDLPQGKAFDPSGVFQLLASPNISLLLFLDDAVRAAATRPSRLWASSYLVPITLRDITAAKFAH